MSFACSFSTLFHSFHHNSPADKAHQHVDQKKHVHDHAGNHHSSSAPKEEKKNDCCSDSVVKMQKVEKMVSRGIEAPNIVFLSCFVTVYSVISSIKLEENKLFPDNVRWRLPATIQDLRIVIQSFQI
ncbi:MAG TPA: hypothetical protein VM888_08085 [Chitinophagaceae bacterium]|nr:hypothetical protein [Chitinophagaceae bacterium]